MQNEVPKPSLDNAIAPHGDSLLDELREARVQVNALRARVLDTGMSNDETLSLSALQQIDAAHEELRTVEEELHAQADEIVATRESLDLERRRYRELFEAAPEAYLVTDLHGNILEANRKAGTLFNTDPKLLVRKPLGTFIALPDRDRFRELLAHFEGSSFSGELRVLPRHGEAIAVGVSARRGAGTNGTDTTLRWLMRSGPSARASEAAIRKLNTRVIELEETVLALRAQLDRGQAERDELRRKLGTEEVAVARS